MSDFKPGYNDSLDAEQQVDCEEAIHSILVERLGMVEHVAAFVDSPAKN